MRPLVRLISNRHFWPLFVVAIIGILASRTLIFQSGYFNMHDDLQMMRQLQMEKCFLDFQIPCRWVPDMGYGFGFPLFNFYPPLPYLIGELFRVVGYSFITSAKLTFALSIIVSGAGMYLLAKEFFGRLGGVLSAAFYIWAPYHAVDVYVRGAMNEAWALAVAPFIFWSGYRLIVSKGDERLKEVPKNIKGKLLRVVEIDSKWMIVLSLSYFALFTSHNLILMIFTPLFGFWVLLHLWLKNSWRKIPQIIFSGFFALLLSAFFTIPALTENKFTHIRDQLVGYYDYAAHFVSIRQLLFSRFWGYGPSVWGVEDDRMSFQIGHLHWIFSIFIGVGLFVYLIVRLARSKKSFFANVKEHPVVLSVLLMIVVGWFSAFMTHSKATPIYLAIDQLRYLQFPWRFLSIIIFTFSFAIGVIPHALHSKRKFFGSALAPLRMVVTIFLIIIIIAFNWNYFLPENGRMGNLTDVEKFSDAAWELQQAGGISDYLPLTAETAPKSPRTELVEVMEGDVIVTDTDEGTSWASFRLDVQSDYATVRMGIMDFPGWKAFSDGIEIEKFIGDDEKWGRIYLTQPSGIHDIFLEFQNTQIRDIANTISLLAWTTLIGYLLFIRVRNTKNRNRRA